MTEAQLFHCPTCGAPLDIQTDARTIRCPYCQNSVAVPAELRSQRAEPEVTSQTISVQTSSSVLDQGELLQLVRSGQKIEAIRQVRQATNLGLKESKDVVEALERGEDMALVNAMLSRAMAGNLQPVRPAVYVDTTLDAAASQRIARAAAATAGTAGVGLGCWVIGLVVFILAVTLVPILIAMTADGGPLSPLWSKINPGAFVAQEFSFGAEGLGPGLFHDPRSIAADKDGNLYVGDYSTGRLQSFDPAGKFRWVANLGEEQYMDALDISNGDVLFAVVRGVVRRFEPATGRELEPLALPEGLDYAEDLAIAPDGRMAVVVNDNDLLVLNPDLQVVITVPGAISAITGHSESSVDVDFDPAGNIYLLGSSSYMVYKFSPDGRYINQFGGQTTDEAKGKFRMVGELGVDMQGRVFVSDIFGIQVFDGDGMYLDTFDFPGFTHGINFDLTNQMYIVTNEPKVMRLRVKK